MTYNEIIEKVSKEVDLPPDVVDKTYKHFWKYIKSSIQALPLKKDLTEEEFNELRTNFNIPSIGKLACTYDRYKSVRERFKNINKIREK